MTLLKLESEATYGDKAVLHQHIFVVDAIQHVEFGAYDPRFPYVDIVVGGQARRVWGDHRATIEAALDEAHGVVKSSHERRVSELATFIEDVGGPSEVVRAKLEKDYLADLERRRTGQPPGTVNQLCERPIKSANLDEVSGTVLVLFDGFGHLELLSHEASAMGVRVGGRIDIDKLRALWRDDYRAATKKSGA